MSAALVRNDAKRDEEEEPGAVEEEEASTETLPEWVRRGMAGGVRVDEEEAWRVREGRGGGGRLVVLVGGVRGGGVGEVLGLDMDRERGGEEVVGGGSRVRSGTLGDAVNGEAEKFGEDLFAGDGKGRRGTGVVELDSSLGGAPRASSSCFGVCGTPSNGAALAFSFSFSRSFARFVRMSLSLLAERSGSVAVSEGAAPRSSKVDVVDVRLSVGGVDLPLEANHDDLRFSLPSRSFDAALLPSRHDARLKLDKDDADDAIPLLTEVVEAAASEDGPSLLPDGVKVRGLRSPSEDRLLLSRRRTGSASSRPVDAPSGSPGARDSSSISSWVPIAWSSSPAPPYVVLRSCSLRRASPQIPPRWPNLRLSKNEKSSMWGTTRESRT